MEIKYIQGAVMGMFVSVCAEISKVHEASLPLVTFSLHLYLWFFYKF